MARHKLSLEKQRALHESLCRQLGYAVDDPRVVVAGYSYDTKNAAISAARRHVTKLNKARGAACES